VRIPRLGSEQLARPFPCPLVAALIDQLAHSFPFSIASALLVIKEHFSPDSAASSMKSFVQPFFTAEFLEDPSTCPNDGNGNTKDNSM
jgi:hypothetical protein